MLRRQIFILLARVAVLLTASAQAETLHVSLVLSDSSPPYRQFADSFNSTIAASKADVSVVESPATGVIPADLIVAVGMKAARLAATQGNAPVLVAMVPETAYRDLLEKTAPQKSNRKFSVIYLDQPWGRRLDFLRAALPEKRKIGLLYSPELHIDIDGLRKDAVAQGGELIAQPIGSAEDLYSALESVLASSDVLLALPDSMVYSSSNIRNILLTSYRHKIPLVGLSKAYVNAGALCAIFSTPEQLAEQAAMSAVSFSLGRQLPVPQYPAVFSIEVNQQVAQSLGIELPSQEIIRRKMDRTGGQDR